MYAELNWNVWNCLWLPSYTICFIWNFLPYSSCMGQNRKSKFSIFFLDKKISYYLQLISFSWTNYPILRKWFCIISIIILLASAHWNWKKNKAQAHLSLLKLNFLLEEWGNQWLNWTPLGQEGLRHCHEPII